MRPSSFTYEGDALDGSAIVRVECRLDDAPFEPCVDGTTTYWDVADGEHTFAVRAIDAAGNIDATPATWTWVVDATAPETTVDAGPDWVADTVTFTYHGDAPGGSPVWAFECRLDGGLFERCPADGRTYAGLAGGEHTFEVAAVDTVGSMDPSPATRTVHVDVDGPETDLAGPPSPASDTTAHFVYSGDPLGSSPVIGFDCRLDGGDFESCPVEGTLYEGMTDGWHRVEARAVDAVGNVDTTPSEYWWIVDTTGPGTSIDTGPNAQTAFTAAFFTFHGDPLGGTEIAGFECAVDGGPFEGCQRTGHWVWDRTNGEHTLAVRALDEAGHADPTPAVWTWTVDTTIIGTTIDTGPASTTSARSATFSYHGYSRLGTIVEYQCRLDDGTFEPCADDGATLSGLDDGEHRFTVRSRDALGNIDLAGAGWTWTVDTTAPETTVDPGAALVAEAAFTYAGDELGGSPIVGFECSIDDGPFEPCPIGGFTYADWRTVSTHWRCGRWTPRATSTTRPRSARSRWTRPLPRPRSIPALRSIRRRRRRALSTGPTPSAEPRVVTMECRLDDGPFSSCPLDGVTYADLAEGAHAVEVRAVDAVGNVDPTPAVWSWTVDTVEPPTTTTEPPTTTTERPTTTTEPPTTTTEPPTTGTEPPTTRNRAAHDNDRATHHNDRHRPPQPPSHPPQRPSHPPQRAHRRPPFEWRRPRHHRQRPHRHRRPRCPNWSSCPRGRRRVDGATVPSSNGVVLTKSSTDRTQQSPPGS